MKKLLYTTFAVILLQTNCIAQNPELFSVSASQVQFPTTMVGKTDSIQITISNQGTSGSFHLSIPFQEYDSQPFYVKDTAIFFGTTSTKSIWVYFRPLHNILNKASLIISADRAPFPVGWQMPAVNVIQTQIPLKGQGRFPRSYYASTENLSEEALKQALKTRLAMNYNPLGYNSARDEMYGNLDNKNDSVTCIYTNRKAKFNTRTGATSNNFNCEHTFPQGYFNQDEPMRSDIHHLFSTDETANNSRGNLPFGIATAPFVSNNAANFPSSNGGGKYEPQDAHKGRCARAMMYFVLRYQDYTNFYQPQDAILRQWHRQFPVIPNDTIRNAAIFALQGNRNPFEDYPQLANRITNLVSNSVSDSTPKIQLSQNSLQFLGPNFPWQPKYHSIVVYNTGNQKLKVSKVEITGDSSYLENLADTAFVLAKNEGRTIFIYKRCGADSIKIFSNDPLNPLKIIPMSCQLTGLEEIDQQSKIMVVPNPVQQYFELKGIKTNQHVEMVWLNYLGKEMARQTGFGNQKIEIPRLIPGPYFLKIESNGFLYIQKVIINPRQESWN